MIEAVQKEICEVLAAESADWEPRPGCVFKVADHPVENPDQSNVPKSAIEKCKQSMVIDTIEVATNIQFEKTLEP
jgi:hypothetical protein